MKPGQLPTKQVTSKKNTTWTGCGKSIQELCTSFATGHELYNIIISYNYIGVSAWDPTILKLTWKKKECKTDTTDGCPKDVLDPTVGQLTRCLAQFFPEEHGRGHRLSTLQCVRICLMFFVFTLFNHMLSAWWFVLQLEQ